MRSEVAEHRFLHQVGMQRRDAIHLVRAHEGEMRHADAPARDILADQRDRGEQPVVASDARRAHGIQVVRIDAEDDLHVARQQALHQRRPARISSASGSSVWLV
jgi:hypothetical protein